MKYILALAFAVLALGMAVARPSSAADPTLKVAVEGRGTIVIRLFAKDAPKATAHIMKLAKDGFYDGQRFFRVTRSPRPYIAQVGDPTSKNGDLDSGSMGSGGTGARIPYEDTGHTNKKYAVGLAALLSKDRDSGDSQFYIVLGDSKFLDGSYTVFGEVIDGKDVVDNLQKGDRISSVTVSN